MTTKKSTTAQTITPPTEEVKFTKFEKARIIGTIATQLSNNRELPGDDEFKVKYKDEMDYINLAIAIFDAGLSNLYIIRKYPNGDYDKVYATNPPRVEKVFK